MILLLARCTRQAPSVLSDFDASTPRQLSLRVPAALTLARSLDTLSVGIDPASLALTQVAVDPGLALGVETDLVVFAKGEAPPALSRHGLSSATDFNLGESIWNRAQDGLPVPGVKYVAEMRIVVFETDIPPGHAWDPHAGKQIGDLRGHTGGVTSLAFLPDGKRLASTSMDQTTRFWDVASSKDLCRAISFLDGIVIKEQPSAPWWV